MTHCSVPALQQRFGVPQQQSVIRIHDVRLGLRLVLLLLRVRVIERLVIVLVKHSALKHTNNTTHHTNALDYTDSAHNTMVFNRSLPGETALLMLTDVYSLLPVALNLQSASETYSYVVKY